jgi:methylmalonyl-CoA carboxyltransferase large subunit
VSGPENRELAALVEAVTALREEVARLGDRVATLEATHPGHDANGAARSGAALEQGSAVRTGPPTADPAGASSPPPAAFDPELLLVISAAIAAFLGKKAYIRQIRLHTSPTWVQVGRVNIQGSHALMTHR